MGSIGRYHTPLSASHRNPCARISGTQINSNDRFSSNESSHNTSHLQIDKKMQKKRLTEVNM